jgi:hypothetical protein
VCRLFGMSGGRRRVRASFWLLEAPDSLALQSRGEPDGAGLRDPRGVERLLRAWRELIDRVKDILVVRCGYRVTGLSAA